MTWVTPPDFVAGAVLSAVDLQKLSDNEKELGDGWTPYAPAWDADTTTPTVGNGSIIGAYRQVGKTVDFWVSLTFGSTTTNGSGAYFWSLPVNAKNGYMGVGTAALIDQSAADYFGGWVWTTSTLGSCRISVGSGVRTSPTAPFVPNTNDSIRFSGTYESV